MQALAALVAFVAGPAFGAANGASGDSFTTGRFAWTTAAPLILPGPAGGEDWHAVKDPSVVQEGSTWHVFATVRGTRRSHAIVHLAFDDWSKADQAGREVLSCHPGYFCAPQVFYFTPHRKWYLICQASDEKWEPDYQPAFSTTTNLADSKSWDRLTPLYERQPANIKAWLDFWVICDERRAHLFFTSLDGKMWRAETSLERFPHGWSDPVVVIQDDIFEASHTYRLKGRNDYLTLIEAQNGDGWRYYKAYLADRLDGPWKPLAADKEKAFASQRNVRQTGQHWTDVISHGELMRVGTDERLEVDPGHIRFLIQGVLDRDRTGKAYGDIPWRLGMLEAAVP